MKPPPKRHRENDQIVKSEALEFAAASGYLERTLIVENRNLRQENAILKDDVEHWKSQVEPIKNKYSSLQNAFTKKKKEANHLGKIRKHLSKYLPKTYLEILKIIGGNDA